MHFGNTTYTNIWVTDGASLYLNYEMIGKVTYIKSVSGSTITGLIDNRGYMLDIYGTESNLAIQQTNVLPVFVSAPSGAVTGATIDSNVKSAQETTQPENAKGVLFDDSNFNDRNLVEDK